MGLKDLTKKQLIQMINNLSRREVVKIKEVIDKDKKPRTVIKYRTKYKNCPNPDDHYKIVTSIHPELSCEIIHEMGQ